MRQHLYLQGKHTWKWHVNALVMRCLHQYILLVYLLYFHMLVPNFWCPINKKIPVWQPLSYTNFTFPLFFDLILCSLILISFRLCDASAFILFSLFCYPQPLSLHWCDCNASTHRNHRNCTYPQGLQNRFDLLGFTTQPAHVIIFLSDCLHLNPWTYAT